MAEGELHPTIYVLIVCAVMVGNLMTLLFIAGWRGYLRGRKTLQGAPPWSYFAILAPGIFAGIGIAVFVMGIVLPMQ